MLWHRRLLAAALAAGAVAAALTVLAPDPPPSVRILAAARDLAAGETLTTADITAVVLPPAAVPDGAIRVESAVVDQVLAVPVRRGEPLTDVRFIGSPLIASLGDGLVATPVRLADAEAAALLRPGDVVDVIAAGHPDDFGQGASTRVIAAEVRVISVPAETPATDFAAGAIEGSALVVLATTPGTATDLAGAAVNSQLSITIRPR